MRWGLGVEAAKLALELAGNRLSRSGEPRQPGDCLGKPRHRLSIAEASADDAHD